MTKLGHNPWKLAKDIRQRLADADQICFRWDDGREPEDEERFTFLIEYAFESSLVLAEAVGQNNTRRRISALLKRAKKNLTATAYSINASEAYSIWAERLRQILDPLETVYLSSQPALESELPLKIIARIVKRFDRVERSLGHRYAKRAAVRVNDEYDVHYILRSLLSLYFDDIRPEDPGSTFAGSATRVDLHLKKERIYIEIKKTRAGTTDASLGTELVEDVVKYSQRPDCEAMVIIIDEREKRLKNPTGLAHDLKKTGQDVHVSVHFIR